MKKVSVIIPCFNQEKYIKEALNSALNQTYKNLEIICINDNSSDNSKEIIENFAKNHQDIIFINLKENKGVAHARNLGIEKSSGEYILPLDSDDTIETTYIEKAVNILDKNPDIGIVYCKAKKFGTVNKYWKLPEYNNCIFATALFRKKDFLLAGKYKENMKDGCEDWDLWLSIIELGLKPYRIDEILFNYRQYKENSRSTFATKNTNWKLSLIKNHLNLYLNSPDFANRVFSDSKILYKKIKKYKNLWILFISLNIIQFIIILLLFFLK